jgi:RNA polymerase sigma-70 factor, ECF subfamily
MVLLMDESLLIKDARNGDLEAFNKLVLAYQDQIYNQAYRMLSDSYAAEDAAQNTFIRAYEKLASYRGGSFRAWLLRIVTNLCYDELRRRKSHPNIALEPLNENGEHEAEPYWMAEKSELPEAQIERIELWESIQRSLALVPSEYRAALILVDIQDFSYVETAEVLGVPVGTVKSRLTRGRKMLRSHLLASAGTPVEGWGRGKRTIDSLVLVPAD